MVAFVASTVLTAANLNSAFNQKTINTQTGTTYTLVLTDQGGVVTTSNASAVTVTIPPNSSVAFATGTIIDFVNLGAGTLTIAAGAGVTVNGTITALAINESASIIKTATNTWSYLAAPTPGLSLITTGTMTAAASISFNNCFTSTYDNYLIQMAVTSASTGIGMRLRLRAAGVDNSSANYGGAYSKQTFAAGTLTGYANDPAGTFTGYQEIFTAQGGATSMVVYGPALSVKTSFTFGSVNDVNVYFGGAQMTVTTAFDGITIFPSTGTITTPTNGIRVYGYRNV